MGFNGYLAAVVEHIAGFRQLPHFKCRTEALPSQSMYLTDTQANNLPTVEPQTRVIHDDGHLASAVSGLHQNPNADLQVSMPGYFNTRVIG
jgi:hypothetical protein